MGRHILSTAFVLSIAAPNAISAQPRQPLIPDWPQTRLAEREPAIRSLFVLAVCIRHERRERAIELLATPPGSLAEDAQAPRTIPRTTQCAIGEWLRVRRFDLFRGAIAEAIYNGDRTRPRGDAALPLTETFSTWRSSETARGARLTIDREVGHWVARCTVHRAPRLAHDLLSRIPGSVRERDGLLALRQTFIDCLPDGQRLDVSRLMMRALIAEQIYHAVRGNRAAFVDGR